MYKRFCQSVKKKSRAASVKMDNKWRKQEDGFACATRV